MLIGIDGNEANIKKRVGSNKYAFELLWGIYRIMQKSKRKNQNVNGKFKIYLKEKPLSDLPKQTGWWQYKVIKPVKFWTQWRLPLALYFSQARPDVFFTPGHYLPRWAPCPLVMAIMDLSYVYFPEMFKKSDLWQLRNWTAHSVKIAKKILTISKFSKDAIIDYYHLDREKVIVAYPGVNQNTKIKMQKSKLKSKIQNLKNKYQIKGDYILYVGTLQPRKNVVRLIEAFKILTSQRSMRNTQLVIVGKKGWLYDEIFQKVKKLGLEDDVIFTGYVSDNDLPVFYQNALCFVLVSLYEGFGLPVLEAMKYGCPVVASNVSSLPEVVGKAGILVNPKDIKSIARGINEAIKKRKKLINQGFKQVKKFSWEKCARQTLEVLKDVAQSH